MWNEPEWARFQREKKPEANKKKKKEWIHFSIHVETGAWTSGKQRCASVGNLEQQEDPEKHTPTQETHIGNMKQLQSGKKKKENGKTGFTEYRLNFSVVCLRFLLLLLPHFNFG